MISDQATTDMKLLWSIARDVLAIEDHAEGEREGRAVGGTINA